MPKTSVTCPRCGESVEMDVYSEGGDSVPYGSTYVRTPDGLVADIADEHACQHMTQEDVTAMEEQAIADVENAGPDTQYDTLEERDLDRN